MKLSSLAIVVVATAAWSTPVVAQGVSVPPGRWWNLPFAERVMQLSQEQRDQLEAITLEHARRMIDLKARVDKAELDVRSLGDSDPFDPDAARAAFDVLIRARSELERERFELLIDVRGALRTEQWKVLKDLARDRVENRLRPRRDANRPGGGAPRRPDF